MTGRQIFGKTMTFVWAKLLLGLATVLASALLFALCMLIGMIGESVMTIMIFVWLGATGAISFFLNHYIGYLLKVGHVAAITEGVTTGKVPTNQISYAKTIVKERFVTSNVYFVVDKLVSGAVRQIQRVAGGIIGIFGSLPGLDSVKSILEKFIEISLGYIDECCLGYTIYKKDQDVYKSAADGVVIYFQNWKTLLKDAAKTTIILVVVAVVVTIAVFALFSLLFKAFGWSQFVAFILSLFVAGSVKTAFVDSWVLCNMMTSYMKVAPTTEITFDLYGKLSGMSKKFKELLGKSNVQSQPEVVEGKIVSDGAKFCPQCGSSIENGTKFCAKCGTKIEE